MTPDLPPPPAELAHLSAHLAPEQLLALVEAHGGTRLYIPHHPPAESPVVRAVGLEAARALGAALGGNTIKVPAAKHWRIRCLHKQGHSYNEIARRVGIGQSAVHRNLSAARLTDAQPDLFRG